MSRYEFGGSLDRHFQRQWEASYDLEDEEVCPKCGRELTCGICTACEKEVDAEG